MWGFSLHLGVYPASIRPQEGNTPPLVMNQYVDQRVDGTPNLVTTNLQQPTKPQTSTADNHHQILKEEKDMQPHNPKQASRAHPPQTRSLRRAISNQSDVLYQNSSSTTTTTTKGPSCSTPITDNPWFPDTPLYVRHIGGSRDRRYCLPNLLLLTRWIGYVGDGGFSTLHR